MVTNPVSIATGDGRMDGVVGNECGKMIVPVEAEEVAIVADVDPVVCGGNAGAGIEAGTRGVAVAAI